jgi:lipoprotein-anchoring transpeptidase ErfK/SrfK
VRWVITFFIVIVIGIGGFLLLHRNNKLGKHESVTTTTQEVTTTTQNNEEGIEKKKPTSDSYYDFLKIENLGSQCYKLFTKEKWKELISALDKKECAEIKLDDIEQLLLKALCFKNINDREGEATLLREIIHKYGKEEIVTNNIAKLLCRFLQIGDEETKFKLILDFLDSYKSFGCLNKDTILQAAEYFFSKKDDYSSWQLYSRVYFDLEEHKQSDVIKRINELVNRIIFSGLSYPNSLTYTVEKGDTLEKIAKKFNLTAALIKKINKLTKDFIYPGQIFKLIKVDDTNKFHILVKKSKHKLYLFYGKNLVREYVVAIGHPQDSPTPEGKFIISSRLVNPAWKGVPFGDPKNILGTRWMGFNDPYANYGIHGTTQPETVGQEVTNGCVRMLNTDAEDLFDFVTIGTQVIIEK